MVIHLFTIYNYFFLFLNYRFLLIKIYLIFIATFSVHKLQRQTFLSVSKSPQSTCSPSYGWRNSLVPVFLSFQQEETSCSRSLKHRLSGKHIRCTSTKTYQTRGHPRPSDTHLIVYCTLIYIMRTLYLKTKKKERKHTEYFNYLLGI